MEIQGFLAYSMVMSGDIQDGYELARRTFTEFDISPDGKKLKEADYYTWAVWKSGVAIRLIDALAERKEYGREELITLLDQAEEILVIPEGDETWGDKNFDYRKDEVTAVREKLSS